MTQLIADTVDSAIQYIFLAAGENEAIDKIEIDKFPYGIGFIYDFTDIDDVFISKWASTEVKIEGNFNSEINGPFLSAYQHINEDLLRLVAFVKYGNGDIRNLSQADIDYFQYRVKIEAGSSNISDNLWEILNKLGLEMVGKMTGHEIVITVLGLGVLISGSYGASAFFERRKEIRLEELNNQEKIKSLEVIEYASKNQSETFAKIVELMRDTNEISRRSVEVAENGQNELLRAASKTGDTIIGGHHFSKGEARELILNNRRKTRTTIVEQEFRVVGGDTSDPMHTSIVLEDLESSEQMKVTFRDRLIDAAKRSSVFVALDQRSTLWFRLSIKEAEGEVVSAQILDLPEPPNDVG